jgi:anti-sigma factor RsiW
MDPLDPANLRRDLSAFADGELDPAGSRRLLQHLLDHPADMDQLRRVQRLNTEAGRVIRQRAPAPSVELLERLRQLAPQPVPRPARPPITVRSWLPLARALAAIVLLVIGLWAGSRMARPTAPVVSTADVLPAAVVSHAEEVHGVCSRLALGLHSGGYPADVAALATSVEQDLHSEHPYPDLSPIGFRYRGAGPCGWPLPDTAHLLYGSVRPGSVNAVSVFVQPWRAQYPLVAGRLYSVSVAQSPFPMLAWRTEHVVYFLLADNDATERSAVALIRGAPTSNPTSP